METPITPDTTSTAEQSASAQNKSARSTSKQRRLDFEEYCAAYFTPIKLGKKEKHQVALSQATFDRLERIARVYGGRDYSVSSFVEHIVIEHLDSNAENYEAWAKVWMSLIGKSL